MKGSRPRPKAPDVQVPGPHFNTAKDRDRWVAKYAKDDKVKVYNSLKEFKERKV